MPPRDSTCIPIFNGHLFSALQAEALSHSRAEDHYLRDLEDQISRDLRVAWLTANSAFQCLALTDQLLDEAAKALDLAQARYKRVLSSIIELSEAQLNMPQAQIEHESQARLPSPDFCPEPSTRRFALNLVINSAYV
jgi:outer membrane protein